MSSRAGPAGVRRSRAGTPVPNVEAADRLHGHAAQERRGGKTAVEVRVAHDRGRFHHVPDRVPGGRPVRSGRVHPRDIVAEDGREPSPPARQRRRRRRQRERRETPAHALLQVPDQQFETKLTRRIVSTVSSKCTFFKKNYFVTL